MSAQESPLNKAHQHGANADEYLAQGLLIPAAEEYERASQAFQECLLVSTDEKTKGTLRMLYNEHAKSAKDVQRKIAKLLEENKDPSLPQSVPQKHTPTPPPVPGPSSLPSPQAGNRMVDSQNTGDESFMLLGQRSEPGDILFNQFWKVTTDLLENISQPVAFASAPIRYPPTPRKEAGLVVEPEADRGITSRLSGFSKRLVDTSYQIATGTQRGQAASSSLQDDLDEVLADTDVLYVTRVQKERFASEEEWRQVKDAYRVDHAVLSRAKEDMIVMHPLPRVNEIDPEVDFDSRRAVYFRQMRYGLFIRMALLASVMA